MNEQIIKYYLPIYMLGYIGVAFVIPSIRTYRKTGINPITFSKEDTAHNYVGTIMKLCIFLLVAMVFTFAFSEKAYAYFVPISYLKKEAIFVSGFVMTHLALIGIIIAQIQMGISWRIGIDEKNKTDLITKGFFSVSRNPIFLGILISALGLFIVLPNALSFALLFAIYIVIQIQVRLEEEFLNKTNKSEYADYCSRVRRWI